MTEANGILLLFDVLSKTYARPIRVLDLYFYLRHTLAPGVLPDDLANLLRQYDSSTLFVVLEKLRSEGYLQALGNTYSLTTEGEEATRELREERGSEVDGLQRLASELAA